MKKLNIKTTKDRKNKNIAFNEKFILPVRAWLSENIFQKTNVVIKKTYRDISSMKKGLIVISIMLIVPFLFLLIPSVIDFGLVSPHHAATVISFSLVFSVFFWTLGIVFTIVIGTSGAPLIAEEIKTGTMLILISKPITRTKIFLGKYLAVFLLGMVLSFIAIFSMGWITVLINSGNIDHFISLIPFLTALYLYSLFITFLFTSITMALSSIFKKSKNVSVVIILIIILTFVGFQFIRTLVGDFYETLQLYHFDLGYHLGNVFIFFMEALNAIPPSRSWQSMFGMLTGVYKFASTIDPDQNIDLGGLEKTNYYLPIFSLLIWIIIAVLLLVLGIYKLKKREISI
jgi:ABC-type transport system involved in multi-copper enzyme maturation permease subunit